MSPGVLPSVGGTLLLLAVRGHVSEAHSKELFARSREIPAASWEVFTWPGCFWGGLCLAGRGGDVVACLPKLELGSICRLHLMDLQLLVLPCQSSLRHKVTFEMLIPAPLHLSGSLSPAACWKWLSRP